MIRSRKDGPHDREAGFSMIELLVVIVIMGVLLAAALPSMRSHTGTIKLKEAADEVAGTLKLARQRAVATNGDVVVQFGAGSSNYYLFDDGNGNGVRDGSETMSGPYDIPKGIALAQCGFSQRRVTFAAQGSASESQAVIFVNAQANAQRVDVSAGTGLVYVSDMYHYTED
jgi:type II secretion system protein H